MRIRALAMVVAVMFAFGGCADDADARLEVFAAASLADAFEEIARSFEDSEGVEVRLNLGASSDLARSIVDGSPAEVFASADQQTMATVIEAGVAQGSETFATNRLAIAVAPANPLGIRVLSDLREVSVALCAPEVPCGHYAQESLDRAGVDLEPDSFEPDVKAVVGRVALGEVDAGIVYVTDVIAADVESVDIPSEQNVVAGYEIAAIADGGSARAFVDLILSEEGRRILERHGFGVP